MVARLGDPKAMVDEANSFEHPGRDFWRLLSGIHLADRYLICTVLRSEYMRAALRVY